MLTHSHRGLHTSGSFCASRHGAGIGYRRTPVGETKILNIVDDNSWTNSRAVGRVLNVKHQSELRTLREDGINPYHLQRVQAMVPY